MMAMPVRSARRRAARWSSTSGPADIQVDAITPLAADSVGPPAAPVPERDTAGEAVPVVPQVWRGPVADER